METYIGYIKTPQDALVIFEACRRGLLNRVQRRLSTKERIHIRSGSIFAWDEREAGMRRWTDGRTWSPSRVLGSFLTYRELDTKRRPRRPSTSSSSAAAAAAAAAATSSSVSASKAAAATCSYKQDGLIKQSFSICTAANQKLHLISYYTKSDVLNGRLKQPSTDSVFSQIVVPKGLYPELNPLDTSGGHSATIHNMRQASLGSPSPLNSNLSNPPSPPPSLSSSPISSDEDMLLEAPPPHQHHHEAYYSPPFVSPPPMPAQQQQQHHRHQQSGPISSGLFCQMSLPPPSSFNQRSPPLAIQEIALDRVPSSEDQRQLRALRLQL